MKKSPWRITIDTNPDQCNLKCIMCDTHSPYNKNRIKRQRMSPELLDQVLQNAIIAGVEEIIPSTMGEPLLYPYFDRFIDILSTSKTTKLNLTTNGTFPKKGAKKWAELLLPITSDTKISINGITSNINEKVMVKANTNEMIANINTYLKVRDEVRLQTTNNPTVTLQTTFMLGNLAGIKEVIEYAIKHKIDRVKGHHLWVTHPELVKQDLRNHCNKGVWNDFIDEIDQYQDQIKLENFTKITDNSIIKSDYNCPFLGAELWIDCYGNYNVCCAPSNQRQTLGNFGNVADIPISNLFKTNNYQNLVKNYKKMPLCQTCLLRKPQ